MNASWHQRQPMPKNASLAERVRWHVANAKACGCREMPTTVVRELRRRGLKVPVRARARR